MFDIWPGASDLDLPAACLRKSKRLTSPTKSREDQWTQWTQWTPHGMGSLRRPSLFTVEAKGPIGSEGSEGWCDEGCDDVMRFAMIIVIICDHLWSASDNSRVELLDAAAALEIPAWPIWAASDLPRAFYNMFPMVSTCFSHGKHFRLSDTALLGTI